MVLCSNSEDVENKLMVDDVYDILTAVSITPEGRVAMCAHHTVSALCKVIAYNCYRMFIISLVSMELRDYYNLFISLQLRNKFLSLCDCNVDS